MLESADNFTGKCVGVIDGDTIDVLRDGKAQRIRLDGIDCPEKGDDFSNKAKQFTSSLVFGKVVEVQGKEYDRYGRLVARVLIGWPGYFSRTRTGRLSLALHEVFL